jgi:hypothetical protein
MKCSFSSHSPVWDVIYIDLLSSFCSFKPILPPTMWPYMEGRREVNNEDLYIQLPIFIGPCIVIYSYNTPNKMHLLSQIIYSCKTLYIFRTVFPSIIRSSKLHIQQRHVSNSCCYLVLAAGSSKSLTYNVAVYAVLSSWWLTKRQSGTCRAFYKNK